jgi:hypothetical protein
VLENGSVETPVAGRWLSSASTHTHEEVEDLLETGFSVRSMWRLYTDVQLQFPISPSRFWKGSQRESADIN